VYWVEATKDALIVCAPKASVLMVRVAVPVESNADRPISVSPSENAIVPEVRGALATTAVAFKIILSPSTPIDGTFRVTRTAFGAEPVRVPVGGRELPYFPATYNEQVCFAGN